ncbi:MAG: transcriptional regulator [Gammaproteobacteria bacterium]|nr:transcriptional regulator [Gammaproteobacteria bacterium]
MTLEPIRITQKQATELLSISINALRKLVQTDPTFPKPYKTGTSRQCAVYYDYQALKQWHKQQLENANAEHGEV